MPLDVQERAAPVVPAPRESGARTRRSVLAFPHTRNVLPERIKERGSNPSMSGRSEIV
jgi:hypothetical protein